MSLELPFDTPPPPDAANEPNADHLEADVAPVPIGTNRWSGIPEIGAVPWGTHFCQFYNTREDLLEILVPYFRAGLESGEFCMWVTAPPLEAADAEAELRRAMPDFDEYLARGAIQILPYSDWYLEGGTFEQGRVLNGWIAKVERATEAGFAGLRLTANTFWLERADWNGFAEYERVINDTIGGYRMLAACTYSLDRCGASEVIDVVQNHQFALIKRGDCWVSIENSERRRILDRLRGEANERAVLVERARLSRELHDGLSQALWLAKLKIGRLGSLRLPSDAGPVIEEAIDAIDAGLAEAREAAMALRMNADAGGRAFRDLLRLCLDDFSDRFGLRATFHTSGGILRLRARVEAELLRITQEAFSNVYRHADATHIGVSLTIEDGDLVLRVTDNGRGFDPDTAQGRRSGIQAMREQAEIIGGTFNVESWPSGGTTVTVTVPVFLAEAIESPR